MAPILSVSDAEADAEIANCKKNIASYQQEIAQAFVDLGYAQNAADIKITMGPEIEFTQIAGREAYDKRMDAIIRQEAEAVSAGKPRSLNPNAKSDAHMPQAARMSELNQRHADIRSYYANNPGIPDNIKPILWELEPPFKSLVMTDELVNTTAEGHVKHQEMSAASPVEVSSPPRSALGVAEWINRIEDRIVQESGKEHFDPATGSAARAYGLKRVEFLSLPHSETPPNSIHLNSVIALKKDGAEAWINAFSKRDLENNADVPKHIPSDLLLCIGKAHIDYVNQGIFLFARAASDYRRFRPDETTMGPSRVGMTTRKEHGNFGTAMFRGEGRLTERIDSYKPTNADKGALRFELRVPCVGAGGHPNKTAYPSQRAMPYEMVEAYMEILANGVRMWKEREVLRNEGKDVPLLTEEDLRPIPETSLPRSRNDAWDIFKESELGRSPAWQARLDILKRLSDDLDTINRLDRDASTLHKGPHVSRLTEDKKPGNLSEGFSK